MQSCVSGVKDWSLVNKLQLNEDETEDALLLGLCQSANLPASLSVGQICVHFADSVRYICVIFDNSLSMRDQVSKVCQTTFLEIRGIQSVRKYLPTEATKTRVSSLVVSSFRPSLLIGHLFV